MRGLRLRGWLWLALSTFALVGCQRFDSLSHLENGEGFFLEDTLIGSSTRVICVKRREEVCSGTSAEVYIEDVRDFRQVEAVWKSYTEVGVRIYGGRVLRARTSSPDGGVVIQMQRLPLSALNSQNVIHVNAR